MTDAFRRLTLRTGIFACLALFVWLALPTLAAPITADQAKTAVTRWLARDATPLGTAMGTAVQAVLPQRDAQGQPLYYAVNLSPDGYVIVAGDDVAEPIIAFVPHGSFGQAGSPMATILNIDLPMRLESARLQASKAGVAATTRHAWSALIGPMQASADPIAAVDDVRVAPLVQSKWNQSTVGGKAVYNYYTPPNAPGSANNYVSGCVATAFAQVLRFFQYPTTGVGTASYQITVDVETRMAALRGGDGNGGPYNWANMTLVPTAQISDAQSQAIGALVADVGTTVGMKYTANESGALVINGATALTRDFKFTQAIRGLDYWSDLRDTAPVILNPNLDAGIPLVIGIHAVNESSVVYAGHAVVVDGYGYQNSTLYHHINMGWGGFDDGWYQVPDILFFSRLAEVAYNTFTDGTGEIISGRVLNKTNAPVNSVPVKGYGANGYIYTDTSDAKGIYALAKIPSNTTYLLTATITGAGEGVLAKKTAESVQNTKNCGNVWAADLTPNVKTPAPQVVYVDDNYAAGQANDGHTWGTDAFKTIQDGINAVADGGTVHVGAGTYGEEVIIIKRLTLEGAGSGESGSFVSGSFTLFAGGTSATNRSTIKGFKVTGPHVGILISGTVNYLTLDDVASVGNLGHGMETMETSTMTDLKIVNSKFNGNGPTAGTWKAGIWTKGSITGLAVDGCEFNGNYIGFYTGVHQSGTAYSRVANVNFTNSMLNDNTTIGFYAETLHNATLDGLTVTHNGWKVPEYDWVGTCQGIAISQLQQGAVSNLIIRNTSITNCGKGSTTEVHDGIAAGVGLSITARDDGDYATPPSTLSNVQITNTTITDCQNGARFGALQKLNHGLSNVVISATISGSVGQDIINESTNTIDAKGTEFVGAPSKAQKELRVWHKTDNSALGEVLLGDDSRTGTKITVPNLTGTAGTAVQISATLTTSTNTPLPNQTLKFSLKIGTGAATDLGTAQTNAQGTATVTYNIPDIAATTGTITVTYDGDATYAGSVGTGTLTISAMNHAPVATNGTLNATEGIQSVGTLTATDQDNNPLTYSIVSQPTKGTVTITNAQTGAYTYMANAGASGTDTFTFKANDGALDSNTATVTVTIAANRPPVAQNGTLIAMPGIAVAGTLVAADPDNNPLTFSIVGQPTVGTVTITNARTGSYTYTAPTGAAGTATFTFKANDGLLDSNTATISVTIKGNAAPVAANGVLYVVKGLSADSALPATDADGQPLTFRIITPPVKGSITLQPATGQYTYTPRLDASGEDTFTYVARDGIMDSNVGTITVKIVDSGNPVAVDDAYTLVQGNTLKVPAAGVLQNDISPLYLPLTAIKVTGTAHGLLTLNADGSFTYTPNPAFAGVDSFTYKVNDTLTDSPVATVRITVQAFRPDLWVRRQADAAFAGDNVYNLDGTWQNKAQTIAAGQGAWYRVAVQNDSEIFAQVLLKGTASGNGWTVRYFADGGTELTGDITSAPGWLTPILAPAATYEFWVSVMPDDTAPGNTSKAVQVHASLSTLAQQQDVVKMTTTLKAVQQADLWLRLPAEDVYDGDDIYVSTDQARTIITPAGTPGSCYLQVQNDGNTTESMRVTGPAGGNGWTVRYLVMGSGEDITDLVTGAGAITPALAPGAHTGFVVQVTPDTTVDPGTAFTALIVAAPATNAAMKDTIKLTAQALKRQPDLQLRTAAQTSYTGGDVYSTDGAGQTLAGEVLPGGSATFVFRVQNDGNRRDNFVVYAGPAKIGWTATYIDSVTKEDITAQVTAGTWQTGLLDPGAVKTFQVTVTATADQRGGAALTLPVKATAAGTTVRDQGAVTVSVTQVHRPDLQIRLQTEAIYAGDNFYTTTGAGQARAQTVDVNTGAVYLFQAQNDGNAPDALTITGPAGGNGWTVEYHLMQGDADITAQVTGAGWTSPALSIGGFVGFYARVLPTGAATPGTAFTVPVTVSAGGQTDVATTATTRRVIAGVDATIRAEGMAGYLGDGLVNTDGTGQSVALTVERNQPANYYCYVKNTGNLAEAMRLTAAVPGEGWTVAYKVMNTNVDITAQITGAGWVTPVLAPGATVGLYAVVTPGAGAAAGTTRALWVKAACQSAGVQQDLVKLTTTLRLVRRPDLLIRTPAEMAYSGDNLYTVTGAGQTKSLTVQTGQPATCYLRVQNDGNANEAFVVTATAPGTGWTLRVLNMGTQADLTAQATGAGLVTPVLAPGAYLSLVVHLTPTAPVPGQAKTVTLRVASVADTTKRDAAVLNAVVPIRHAADLLVRAEGETDYTGDDLIGTSLTEQVKGLAVGAGQTARYYLRAQNDGNVSDALLVKGPAGGTGWTVQYLTVGSNTDITAQVTGAGWTTATLAPGAYAAFWVKVTPSDTVTPGAAQWLYLTAAPTTDLNLRDAVSLKTSRALPGQ